MRRLQPSVPPRSYRFVDPDTGYQYKAPDKTALIKLIVSYREQNKLPYIEHIDLVLENYWCSLQENLGSCREVNLRRGFMAFVKGGIALVENLLYKNMVDQNTADARAAICVECPYNVFPDKGGFLKWSDDIAEASTGGKKSIFHDRLGSCEVCTCTLKAKVFYSGKIKLTDEERTKMLAVNCWQPALEAQHANSK